MRQQHERGENSDAIGTNNGGQEVRCHIYDGGHYEHRNTGRQSAVYANRRGVPEIGHIVRGYHAGYRRLAQVEKCDSSDFKRINRYPVRISFFPQCLKQFLHKSNMYT